MQKVSKDIKDLFKEWGIKSSKAAYRKLVNELGYVQVRSSIGILDDQYLLECYKKDRHFNSISIKIWDACAGVYKKEELNTRKMVYVIENSCVANLLFRKFGVNCISPSELVCILKTCAEMSVEMYCSKNGIILH